MVKHRILVIDDEDSICRVLKKHLQEKGYEVATSLDGESGLKTFEAFDPQGVILDIRLPDWDGLKLLAILRQRRPGIPVIIITAFGDMQTTIRAMQNGAYDYLRKPIDIDELDRKIEICLKAGEDRDHPGLILKETGESVDIHRIIGNSRKIQEIFKIIGSVSNSRTTVLIQGESGTGKELIARAIHNASPSRNAPFIAINCGVLMETLLSSELFGHEKGAFTGAIAQKKGRFEIVGDGTIFLDEIEAMTVANQVKLLRVLQEREFERVGGNVTLTTSARIIAATIPPLEEMVAKGEFREDLYYRLKVVTISIPPLRERREDIPSLVEYFVRKVNRELNKSITRIPDETMALLVRNEWKGNIRELENTIRQAMVMCRGDILHPACIDQGEKKVQSEVFRRHEKAPFKDLESVEAAYIQQVLDHTRWNKFQASKILNISRPTLDRKIKQHGLHPHPQEMITDEY
jgi:two-component system, NtrC family, response regulator AtoC